MRILIGNQIQKAIIQCSPTKIAVAYIGRDWCRFVKNASKLKSVIVSPTLGTNPEAVFELANKIGWKKIFFLNELHAKIYLGQSTAVFGSANLTNNGLSGEKLIELCMEIENSTIHKEFEKIFEDFKRKAQEQYPTESSKIERLRLLKIMCYKAQMNHLAKDKSVPKLSDFRFNNNLDRIHIAWYPRTKHVNLNTENINAAFPETRRKSLEDYYFDIVCCLEEDDVRDGDWILCWKCKDNGLPTKNGHITWLRVHHVVPQGVCDEEPYTKLVGQIKEKAPGTPPFELTKGTKNLIRAALESGEFPELIDSDGSDWKLKPADNVTPRFLQYIQE